MSIAPVSSRFSRISFTTRRSSPVQTAASRSRRRFRLPGLEPPGLALTVVDSGVGISQEMLPRVFDLFVQSEGVSDPDQGGLGIGLALVRKLVEMHAGHVEVSSEGRDRGTQVTIRLPLAVAPSVGERPMRPSGEVGAIRCRVLVVDDNEDAARTLAMLVREVGGESQAVGDGQSALGCLLEFQPQIVLLDIGLPGVDGYETCRRIRQSPGGSDVMIVALTGWGLGDGRQSAIGEWVTLHLTKTEDPVTLHEVLA